MVRFSIIIPVYNVAKYLPKCLDSALQQSFCKEEYEIIVVDDGSIDNSGAILDQYAKKHASIRAIHQKNRGLGGARNTGIRAANGEYLIFLDSDDYISPEALSELDCYLRRYMLDILAFDCVMVSPSGETLQIVSVSEYISEYTSLNAKQFLLLEPSSCTKVYRRTLFTNYKIEFPEHLWYEDLATVFKLAPYANKIGYLKVPLYFYVQRGNSITHSQNTKRMMEIIEAFDRNVQYYKQSGLWHEYFDELEWNCVLHVLYYSAFRFLGCGYHRRQIKELYEYSKTTFPLWENNKYVIQQSNKRYLMNLIIHQNYFAFYLRTGFFLKYINPLISSIIKWRDSLRGNKKEGS